MAITQEDCIAAYRAEKKQKAPTGPSSAQPPRYRLVQNTPPRAPQRNAPTGRFVFRPPQQQGGFRPPAFQQPQQFGPRPNTPQFNRGNDDNRCFNCGSTSHFAKNCPQPKKSYPGKNLITTTRARARSKWFKSDKGELISLLLQSFLKEHQSCRVFSLSTINPQSYYLILVQLIVL